MSTMGSLLNPNKGKVGINRGLDPVVKMCLGGETTARTIE